MRLKSQAKDMAILIVLMAVMILMLIGFFTTPARPVPPNGDANGDGTVTATDSILMRRYLQGADIELRVAMCDWNGNNRIDYYDIHMTDSAVLYAQPAIAGDANGDGSVNAADLTMMKRNSIGAYDLTDEQIWVCDADMDGRIGDTDIETVRKLVMEDAG